MNITNSQQEWDKQNINSQNMAPNLSQNLAYKKKPIKKSTTRRYTTGRTAQAIKRLTLDLKLKLIDTKCHKKEQQKIQITLSNNEKTQNFICYPDQCAIEEMQKYGNLLKKHTTDHDVDSDEQHLGLCIQYLTSSLIDAGENRSHK